MYREIDVIEMKTFSLKLFSIRLRSAVRGDDDIDWRGGLPISDRWLMPQFGCGAITNNEIYG
jgi:hypothetical protein